jgi:hypothetical protein
LRHTQRGKRYSRREFLTAGAGAVAGVTGAALVGSSAVFPRSDRGPGRSIVQAAGGLKKFSGATVNAVFVSGEHDDTLLRQRISDVRDTLGINLTVTDLGADAMHDKITQGLRSGHSPYEVSTIVGSGWRKPSGPGTSSPWRNTSRIRRLPQRTLISGTWFPNTWTTSRTGTWQSIGTAGPDNCS